MVKDANIVIIQATTKQKAKVLLLRGIKLTRCNLLDTWFDYHSKRLDEEEKKQKKDLITGEKK